MKKLRCIYRAIINKNNRFERDVEYSYSQDCIWVDYSPTGIIQLYKIHVSELQIRHWLRFDQLIIPNLEINSDHLKLYADAHKSKWKKTL